MVLLASGCDTILARKGHAQTKKDILVPLPDKRIYDISGSSCCRFCGTRRAFRVPRMARRVRQMRLFKRKLRQQL
jgi:hypothetical protein